PGDRGRRRRRGDRRAGCGARQGGSAVRPQGARRRTQAGAGQMSDVTVRLATEADLPAIRDIYNHYVHTSTATFQLDPDTEADRLAWFRGHGEKHPATVAEAGGAVVGFGPLWAW